MKTEICELEIDDCLGRLMAVLDKDIESLESNIASLDALRRLVVKQDNDGLSRLLDKIRSESGTYQDNERRRQTLRKELAGLLDCGFEEITLSQLERRLEAGKRAEIAKRKNKLQALAGLLKKEHAGTQMLLADCERFNRMLLKSLFESGRSDTITYSRTGAAKQQADTVFMNLQF